MNKEDFLEWFRGFTDAEGCFFIGRNKDKYFKFVFKITLHLDDRGVLEYIKKFLEIGKIYISKMKFLLQYTLKKKLN